MTNTVILNGVPSTFNNVYYSVSSPSNIGYIVIDINESSPNYDKTKRQLGGIVFKFYNKVNNEYIPINKATYIWNSGADVCKLVKEVPSTAYMTIQAVVDGSVPKAEILATYPIQVNYLA